MRRHFNNIPGKQNRNTKNYNDSHNTVLKKKTIFNSINLTPHRTEPLRDQVLQWEKWQESIGMMALMSKRGTARIE